jgi:hypothetical protein
MSYVKQPLCETTVAAVCGKAHVFVEVNDLDVAPECGSLYCSLNDVFSRPFNNDRQCLLEVTAEDNCNSTKGTAGGAYVLKHPVNGFNCVSKKMKRVGDEYVMVEMEDILVLCDGLIPYDETYLVDHFCLFRMLVNLTARIFIEILDRDGKR